MRYVKNQNNRPLDGIINIIHFIGTFLIWVRTCLTKNFPIIVRNWSKRRRYSDRTRKIDSPQNVNHAPFAFLAGALPVIDNFKGETADSMIPRFCWFQVIPRDSSDFRWFCSPEPAFLPWILMISHDSKWFWWFRVILLYPSDSRWFCCPESAVFPLIFLLSLTCSFEWYTI